MPEILAMIAQSPKAALILPASLFNRGLADTGFDCRPIEPTLFDPVLAVTGLALSAVADLLTEELRAPCKGRRAERETLSLKYCRSFLALYEEGNVGRAAQRLSIVQPALTVQLHRIEELAGCSLFTRSHQGLRANPRADVLHRLLQPLVQRFATTLRDLRASPGRRATPIRIGLIPALDDESVMSQGFAVALDCWSRAHPDEVLQVMEGYSGTLLRWLQNGMVDFALVDRFVADPELVLEPMVEDKMAVVVAADSDLLAPGPVRLAELASLPLVLPSARHGLRTLLAQTLSRHGLSLTPRIEVEFDGRLPQHGEDRPLRHLAADGLGRPVEPPPRSQHPRDPRPADPAHRLPRPRPRQAVRRGRGGLPRRPARGLRRSPSRDFYGPTG